MISAVRAVLWGFFGVRRQASYEKDGRTLSPKGVIGAGLFLALAFVLALIGVVSLVTAR